MVKLMTQKAIVLQLHEVLQRRGFSASGVFGTFRNRRYSKMFSVEWYDDW
jgi:hypothetical protein